MLLIYVHFGCNNDYMHKLIFYSRSLNFLSGVFSLKMFCVRPSQGILYLKLGNSQIRTYIFFSYLVAHAACEYLYSWFICNLEELIFITYNLSRCSYLMIDSLFFVLIQKNNLREFWSRICDCILTKISFWEYIFHGILTKHFFGNI